MTTETIEAPAPPTGADPHGNAAPFLIQVGNKALHRCVNAENAPTTAHDHETIDRSGPTVTYLHIPSTYTFDESKPLSAAELALHLARNPNVTKLPDYEAALVATHPTGGMWPHHSFDAPAWIASTNEPLGRLLADFYGCDFHDITNDEFHRWKEDTHHTLYGVPGVGPQAGPLAPQALKVNSGNDIQAALLGGGQVDFAGTATASAATTLTMSGATWTTNQWAGCRVYAATAGSPSISFGVVVSNTATVLTVDRWYTVATPGGVAGTTPSATGVFVIVGGGNPQAWFMGLTATATSPTGTDTSLTGEIVTASGGLIRKICPYAHSSGVNTYTLTPVYTANGSDTLPVTVAAIGVFNSMVVADTTTTMLFHTLLNATATLSASGDQLTVTETVTM